MRFMLEPDAYELLKSNGIPIPDYRFAQNIDEAEQAANEIGYPVVIKIVSEDIIHKTDIGAVKVGLKNSEQLREAYKDIVFAAHNAVPCGRHKGVLITKMINGGVETIVGLGNDPEFGKFMMFGMGGIFVELYKDVSFRLIPMSNLDAKSIIEDVKGSVLLKGYRGSSPKNIEALISLIMGCSHMIESNPDIKEMDLNPVIVREDGVYVLDARVCLES